MRRYRKFGVRVNQFICNQGFYCLFLGSDSHFVNVKRNFVYKEYAANFCHCGYTIDFNILKKNFSSITLDLDLAMRRNSRLLIFVLDCLNAYQIEIKTVFLFMCFFVILTLQNNSVGAINNMELALFI